MNEDYVSILESQEDKFMGTRSCYRMRIRIANLKWFERALLIVGLILVGISVTTYVSGRIYSQWEVARFHAGIVYPAGQESSWLVNKKPVDFSLWSRQRIEAYEATYNERIDKPLALLKMDKLRLEVPVYEGTDDLVLNRGLGRIVGTAHLGESGNVGIAGHRDGFFRGLKDVSVGDTLEIETVTGTQTYIIDWIRVVGREDVSVLKNESGSALTLVTCYPFYFVGSAPKRYIVHASLRDKYNTQNEPAKASLQATASGTKENTQ